MISIIIPTYNRGYSLARSIDSILAQSFKEFELIIVDDNSSDDTEKIVASYNDERIRYIKHSTNYGANKARNTGIINSKFDYIAFQDSDDEWLPDKLKIQFEELKARNVDVVSCSMIRYDDEEIQVIPSRYIKDETIFPDIMFGNFMSTQTLLGKKECFINEQFDENLPRLQDWDLVIRLVQKYKVSFINKPLVNVYLQNDSITKNASIIKSLNIMEEKYKDLINKDVEIQYRWARMKIEATPFLKDRTVLLVRSFFIKPYSIKSLGTYIKSIFNKEI